MNWKQEAVYPIIKRVLLAKKKMNKYDKYFKEIIGFLVEIQISSIEEFEGATNEEIENLEEKLNFRFENPMRSYLKMFGRKMGGQNFDLAKYAIGNILSAERKVKKDGFRNKVLKGKLLDLWDGTEYENELNEICFINYFEQNYHFTFINSKDETCRLYSWESGDESFKHQSTIFSELRERIYIGLKSICDARREKEKNNLPKYRLDWYNRTSKVQLEKLKWLDVFRNKYVSNNLFVKTSHEFDKMIQEVEKVEDRLIGLQEYGEAFQKLLKKNSR